MSLEGYRMAALPRIQGRPRLSPRHHYPDRESRGFLLLPTEVIVIHDPYCIGPQWTTSV